MPDLKFPIMVDKVVTPMDATDLANMTIYPPQMTTAARDAMVNPPKGMMIYNTTTNKLNVRVAAAWEAVTSA